jgi:hypothetical protein
MAIHPDEHVPLYVREEGQPGLTVAELIAILQQCPPNLRVVVNGYEGGVEEPSCVQRITIELDENEGIEVCGRHSEYCGGQTDREVATAILLRSRS